MKAMTFGERVSEIIGQRGLSQRQIELQTGRVGQKVTQSHLSRIINGQMPSLDRAMALAEVLGVSLDWLTTGKTYRPERLDPYERELVTIYRELNEGQRDILMGLARTYAAKSSPREK